MSRSTIPFSPALSSKKAPTQQKTYSALDSSPFFPKQGEVVSMFTANRVKN